MKVPLDPFTVYTVFVFVFQKLDSCLNIEWHSPGYYSPQTKANWD